jgi:hypothetical protein
MQTQLSGGPEPTEYCGRAKDARPSNGTAWRERVYPNPNKGMMTLEYQLGEGEKGILEVFSLIGQRVYAQGLRAESSRTTVELSDVTSGIYMIRIVVDGRLRLSEKMTILKE